MNEKTNLKDVVFDNNCKLEGVCEILTDIIKDDNTRSGSLYCVLSILKDVIKSQTI